MKQKILKQTFLIGNCSFTGVNFSSTLLQLPHKEQWLFLSYVYNEKYGCMNVYKMCTYILTATYLYFYTVEFGDK